MTEKTNLCLPEPQELLLSRIETVLIAVETLHPLLDLLKSSQDPEHRATQEDLGEVLRRIYAEQSQMRGMQAECLAKLAEIEARLDALFMHLHLPIQ